MEIIDISEGKLLICTLSYTFRIRVFEYFDFENCLRLLTNITFEDDNGPVVPLAVIATNDWLRCWCSSPVAGTAGLLSAVRVVWRRRSGARGWRDCWRRLRWVTSAERSCLSRRTFACSVAEERVFAEIMVLCAASCSGKRRRVFFGRARERARATESTTGLDFVGWLALVVFCGRGGDGADERDRDPYLGPFAVHRRPTAAVRRLRNTETSICDGNNRSVRGRI